MRWTSLVLVVLCHCLFSFPLFAVPQVQIDVRRNGVFDTPIVVASGAAINLTNINDVSGDSVDFIRVYSIDGPGLANIGVVTLSGTAGGVGQSKVWGAVVRGFGRTTFFDHQHRVGRPEPRPTAPG